MVGTVVLCSRFALRLIMLDLIVVALDLVQTDKFQDLVLLAYLRQLPLELVEILDLIIVLEAVLCSLHLDSYILLA